MNTKEIMKHFIFTALITILLSNPLLADDFRIAIMNFEADGVTKSQAQNVTKLIRNELIKTGRYTVIEQNLANQILKERSFLNADCTNITCAVNAGKILSAGKVIIGTVANMDGMIIIVTRIVDTKSKSIESSFAQNAKSENDINRIINTLIKKNVTKNRMQ
ncbi:MAG: hypothetical protein GY870_01390 [archaeon]|nr:hypothetical protein [archaeon]